ncbi:MAG: type II secretion system protein M [Demequina sp.]|nr:type II secretion system protein M [Demequina sp.]
MNKNQNARSLVLLTILGAVVIIAIAWFLLISPVLSGAAEASEAAVQQESQNENTQIQVNKLKAQFASIDDYQTQLEALQVQIPTTQDYADLQRQFSAIAAAHDVVITSLSFGSAQPIEQSNVTDESAGETTDPTTDDAATDDSATDGSTDTSGTATDASKNIARLYGIPVTVAMTGSYDDLMAALNEMQTGEIRLILITDVSLTQSDEADAAGGDTSAVFGGQTFVLTGSTPEEAAPDASGTSPSPSPAP